MDQTQRVVHLYRRYPLELDTRLTDELMDAWGQPNSDRPDGLVGMAVARDLRRIIVEFALDVTAHQAEARATKQAVCHGMLAALHAFDAEHGFRGVPATNRAEERRSRILYLAMTDLMWWWPK